MKHKINKEQLVQNMRQFVGIRCMLLSPHPHAGKIGVTDRVELVGILKKPGIVVELDEGGECFVFDNKEIRPTTAT